MSRRTLPDELRSVLLSHSLDAPDPDDTVERILAETVAGTAAAAAPADLRRRWRPSVGLVGAAASVALLMVGVLGVRTLNHSNSDKTASGSAAMSTGAGTDSQYSGSLTGPRAAQASQADGNAALLPPVPNLGCSATLPGSKVVTGASTSFRTTATTVFVFEFYCLAPNGERGGSQLEAFQQIGGKLVYLSTLVEATKGSHLQTIAGNDGGVTLTGTSEDSQPGGDLVSLTATTRDGGRTFDASGHLIAAACRATDLTTAVSTVAQVSATDGHVIPGHLVLQLTNRSTKPCALEGYPSLVTQPAGTPLDKSLSGPAGGVTRSSVPPIIELEPGTTAGAMIESSPRHPACAATSVLRVSLANGIALGSVPTTVVACGATVHPFVDNAQGNG